MSLNLVFSKIYLMKIGNINNFIPYIIMSFVIYLYFRIKGFIFNKKNINSRQFQKKLILIFFEFVVACLLQIFWISGISIKSNFIYFAG